MSVVGYRRRLGLGEAKTHFWSACSERSRLQARRTALPTTTRACACATRYSLCTAICPLGSRWGDRGRPQRATKAAPLSAQRRAGPLPAPVRSARRGRTHVRAKKSSPTTPGSYQGRLDAGDAAPLRGPAGPGGPAPALAAQGRPRGGRGARAAGGARREPQDAKAPPELALGPRGRGPRRARPRVPRGARAERARRLVLGRLGTAIAGRHDVRDGRLPSERDEHRHRDLRQLCGARARQPDARSTLLEVAHGVPALDRVRGALAAPRAPGAGGPAPEPHGVSAARDARAARMSPRGKCTLWWSGAGRGPAAGCYVDIPRTGRGDAVQRVDIPRTGRGDAAKRKRGFANATTPALPTLQTR